MLCNAAVSAVVTLWPVVLLQSAQYKDLCLYALGSVETVTQDLFKVRPLLIGNNKSSHEHEPCENFVKNCGISSINLIIKYSSI